MHPGNNMATGTGTGNTAGGGSGTAGTTGVSAGTAGTGAGTGGMMSAGDAGTTGVSTGTAGTTGSTGTAGVTGTGTAGTGAVSIADMIDNLDDSDGRIIVANGRQGPWHIFNDQNNGGNQQPSGSGPFAPQTGGANNTTHGAHTSGSGYGFGGIGFDLNNSTMMPESTSSMPYNASAFTGIRFWAKGNGNLRVEFPQRNFVPTDRGGSCSGTCWNVYGSTALQGKLTSSWQQFTILFSSLVRDDGSTSSPFDRAALMGIAFKHIGSTFDFWIDEVEFVGGTGTTGAAGTTGTTGSGGRGGTMGTAGTSGAAGRGGTTGTAGTTGAAGTGNSNVNHPPPITSGGMNGWGSRYWDCCKPSCGWSANTGGRSPAKTCGQQNQSVGADTQSACSGGGGYMCWDEAPWSLDDTLAYGFAAHNGVPCGRCYQLQFTGSSHNGSSTATAPLNGKTMIVQVSNIGGIASDQFDLLIPGGGVGANPNTCPKQFSGDLGATNGGLLTGCNNDKACVMQKCQSLFAGKQQLLDGCAWFVGWFNGADNPNFVFKQIACPAAITQRSGLGDPG